MIALKFITAIVVTVPLSLTVATIALEVALKVVATISD